MNTAEQDDKLCNAFVSWWGGEYEGTCELPKDHKGPHYDGVSCFDIKGKEVELKQPPPPRLVLTFRYQRAGIDLYRLNQVLDGHNPIIVFRPEQDVTVAVEVQS